MPKNLPAAPVAFLLAACAAACSGPAAPKQEPARTVRLVAAQPRQLRRVVTAVGTLAAEERADLSFKVAGRLKRLAVDIGSRLPAGGVVAELEPTDFVLNVGRARAALVQARARLGLPAAGADDDVKPESTATVRQAKAKLEQSQAELARNKSLFDQALLSRATFDVVEANYKVAESQYNDALEEANNRRGILAERRSSLMIAEQQLTDATLVAPFAGSVQQRRANIGEYLAAGTPVATLVKVNPIRLKVDVPERDAKSIRKGLDVMVRLEGDPKSWLGTVSRVAPALEESNRSLVVEAEIANPDGALRPGSFAKAEIATDPGTPAIVVPASAVVVFAGIEKVLTVKDGKAVERPVVTGRKSEGLVEIVSGIEAGSRVVEKPGNLATGMRVVEESVEAGARGSGGGPGAAPASAN